MMEMCNAFCSGLGCLQHKGADKDGFETEQCLCHPVYTSNDLNLIRKARKTLTVELLHNLKIKQS